MLGAVIFDMDGVIVNSSPYHFEAFRRICQDKGRSVSDKELKALAGKRNEDIFDHLFPDETHLHDSFAKEKEELYHTIHNEATIAPLPGLMLLLKELEHNNVPCAVATSAPPENVKLILDETGTSPYFAAIVDSTQVTHGKPNPEVFITAAERVGARPEQCVVLEDSFTGIEAAKSAGMKVIGVATTHTKEELEHTDLVIRDFTELGIEKLRSLF